jgi:hypothetical protein
MCFLLCVCYNLMDKKENPVRFLQHMQSIALQYNNPVGLRLLMKWATDEIPSALLTNLLAEYLNKYFNGENLLLFQFTFNNNSETAKQETKENQTSPRVDNTTRSTAKILQISNESFFPCSYLSSSKKRSHYHPQLFVCSTSNEESK